MEKRMVKMGEFYTEKQLVVGHPDGWRYLIFINDDPPLINIEYQEYDKETKGWRSHKDCGIHGLWKESAKMVGQALIELSEFVKE
jgi:desulfoferrodoxin (superoxide reductase-like protein)